MKVVVCKDEDAEALLAKMRLKERDQVDRFGQQDAHQKYVATEVTRALMYVLIEWLQAQGFKTPCNRAGGAGVEEARHAHIEGEGDGATEAYFVARDALLAVLEGQP